MSNFTNDKADKKKVDHWDIQQRRDISGAYFFTVYCTRCLGKVLEYTQSVKLKPVEVEHCKITDVFYVTEVIFKTETLMGELPEEKDISF